VAPTCNNNAHFSMQCGLRLRPTATPSVTVTIAEVG